MSKNKQDIINRMTNKGVFPHQFAFTLLIPLRNIFLSPRQLIHHMELQPFHQVLEVGPGPGYFSKKIAKVLTEGQLILADIQQEMLDYAKKRINKKNLTNVDYYLCDGNDFAFADNRFDRIFMVTVIGEVENKERYLQEFYRILKPGGILSISELAGDPDKMSPEELKDLAANAGFTTNQLFGNKRNFTLNFKKA